MFGAVGMQHRKNHLIRVLYKHRPHKLHTLADINAALAGKILAQYLRESRTAQEAVDNRPFERRGGGVGGIHMNRVVVAGDACKIVYILLRKHKIVAKDLPLLDE